MSWQGQNSLLLFLYVGLVALALCFLTGCVPFCVYVSTGLILEASVDHYSVFHVRNNPLYLLCLLFADLSTPAAKLVVISLAALAYPLNILLQSFISVCRVDLSTSMSACVACSTKCGLHETINTEPQRPFTGLVYEAQAAPNTSLNKKAVQPWQYKILYQSCTFVVLFCIFLSGTQLRLYISTSIVCDACTPMVELSEIKDVSIFCTGSDYNSVFMAYEHTAF